LDVRDAFPSVQSGPYIYMFNHTSLLDTFIAIAILPEFTGAIGKKEQFRIPIWGHLLRRWGTIPIERGKLQSAIQSLNKAEIIMNAGNSLLIAPEGTRSADGHLQPFKKGPFHIAIKTQTPIVLIGIIGAFQSKRKGSWLLRPGTITVHIPPPIPTKGHTVLSLREEAQRVMCSVVV
ncbi:MAG: lysophospholipid acyltransferase family protein, partial [Myxococcota bacterium]|nr:lysophospholipid acyltransferase family protein [Myxococcota bacterium]